MLSPKSRQETSCTAVISVARRVIRTESGGYGHNVPANSVDEFPRQYARTRRFTSGAPRDFQLAANDSLLLFLRATSDAAPALTLWAFDTETGDERQVVQLSSLGIDEANLPKAERERRERARESAGGIVSYRLDSAENRACFALGGELHVVDLLGAEVRRIKTPGSVSDPRFSPDGETVAFVSDRSFYVVPDDGTTEAILVRHDDDPLIAWGRAEFVAAEEMQRSAGYWWAPDSDSFFVSRVDTAPVLTWWIADPAHPSSEPTEIRYPAAGTANAAVELHHIDRADPSRSRPINWSDNGRFEYLVDVVWDNDHPPLVVRQTRDQRLVDIAAVDLASGSLSSLHSIRDDIWVEIFPGTPSWHSDQLLTIEDRGETRSLCREGQPITPDGMQVRSLLSAADGSALISLWTDPSEIHLAKVNLTSGETTLLTHEPGVHSGLCSDNITAVTRVAVDADTAGTAVWRDGTLIGSVTSFSSSPVVTAAPLFRRLGPNELSAAVFLPSWHDGVTRLPVLCDPYGGPHAQRVLQSQNAHTVSQWFAELGYAVLVIDGRGTPGRGPAHERTVVNDLATGVLQDQIDGLDAVIDEFPFLDLDRVGIRGWSFGGYLAALAVLSRPDRFHAALAGAPVTSWHLYDTHYTERYLGHPEANPAAYEVSDLLRLPSVWQHDAPFPPLMLIHGLADDNVVAAHTLQLSSALLAAGLAHQVLPLTGVTHMTPQEIVAENLLRIQADFLGGALKPITES